MRHSRYVPLPRPLKNNNFLFSPPWKILFVLKNNNDDNKIKKATLEAILLILAVLAVPWMLIPKPFLLKAKHEAKLHALESGHKPLIGDVKGSPTAKLGGNHGEASVMMADVGQDSCKKNGILLSLSLSLSLCLFLSSALSLSPLKEKKNTHTH